jgi:Mg-chelatase subunit ChlD
MRRRAILYLGLILWINPGVALWCAEIDASQTEGLQDTILVLDNSGSMRDNDPKFWMKRAVERFARETPPMARVGLLLYDQQVTLVAPLTALSEQRQESFMKKLDRVDYTGLLTNTPAAIERALYELKLHSREGALKSIILLTDGIVDTGSKLRDVEATRWLREGLAADATRNSIRIFAIALADKADFQLLQSLAFTTQGDYFRAYQAADMERVFTRIRRTLEDLNKRPPSAPPPRLRTESGISEQVAGGESPAFVTLELIGQEDESAETTMDSRHPASEVAPSAASLAARASDSSRPLARLTGVLEMPSLWIALVGAFIITVMGLRLMRGRRSVLRCSDGQLASIAGSAMPQAFLYDLNGATNKHQYELRRPVTVIGRAAPEPYEPAAYLLIDHDAVSRRHATIEYKDYEYRIIDQKSRNGTFVNGKRVVGEVPLRHGDRLRFHDCEFEFALPVMDAAGETVFVGITDEVKNTNWIFSGRGLT